jgi:hypothetical protein
MTVQLIPRYVLYQISPSPREFHFFKPLYPMYCSIGSSEVPVKFLVVAPLLFNSNHLLLYAAIVPSSPTAPSGTKPMDG